MNDSWPNFTCTAVECRSAAKALHRKGYVEQSAILVGNVMNRLVILIMFLARIKNDK